MLIARLRCWFDGHDLRFADDPRPREHHPSGRPILRKARVVCEQLRLGLARRRRATPGGTAMRAHLKYAAYVARHKWFVFRAGLRTGAPLWRLLIHDYSKLSRAEWGPYVRRFFSGNAGKLDKSADPDDFHRAWTHHWHRNPHHWEHWLTAEREPLRMPQHFVREMVADWMGAGRAITGKWEAANWYASNRDRMNLHPETRALVDALVAEHGGSA